MMVGLQRCLDGLKAINERLEEATREAESPRASLCLGCREP